MRLTRNLLTTLMAVFTSLLISTAHAESIDPNTAEGAVKLNRKVQCSLNDGEEMVYYWTGRAYSRVTGERDKHLFNLEGMNIRQCFETNDPVRGVGYKLRTREILLYLDPKTNEILESWENPWTGETNEVIQVLNDPVNHTAYGKTKSGEVTPFDLKDTNGTFFVKFEVPLFYTNPMGGSYQKYVGGTYHATEIFDFNGSTEELLDASKSTAYPIISWIRISDWLPFMEMNGRTGTLYMNSMGKKLESYDQMSDLMKNFIAEQAPKYRHAPPEDDARRNETSWTYTKKILDERNAEKK